MNTKHADKPLDPHRIDLRGLARQAAVVAGQAPQSDMARLTQSVEVAKPGDDVVWSATGELRPVSGDVPQVWLHVLASTRAQLVCQRCLNGVEEALEVSRSFLFVEDEEQAARLDEEIDDDVLVMPRWLDLLELLEDELILALPIVPTHEICPNPLPMSTKSTAEDPSSADDTPAAHPFAALAALKKPSQPN